MDFLENVLYNAADELGIDWEIKLAVAHDCAWSIEVRITPHPNSTGPDVSTVLFLTGADDPEMAARMMLPYVKKSLTEIQRETEVQ